LKVFWLVVVVVVEAVKLLVVARGEIAIGAIGAISASSRRRSLTMKLVTINLRPRTKTRKIVLPPAVQLLKWITPRVNKPTQKEQPCGQSPALQQKGSVMHSVP
jgi:hypothetical protein